MSKKDFYIKIGDKDYTLRYNFNAMAYVEDLSNGQSFFDVLKKTGEGSLVALRLLLAAGLRQYHKLNLETVGNLIDDVESLTDLIKTVMDAVNNYFVKSKGTDGDDGEVKKNQDSTSQAVA